MLKIKKIDHVAVVVNDIDESLKKFHAVLGLDCSQREVVASQKTEAALLPIGDASVELIQPVGNEGLEKFLDKRGPGLHHIAVEVEGIEEALKLLEILGIPLIDKAPRVGARGHKVAVFIRLCDRSGRDHFAPAHHGHVVTVLQHLGQPVRDHDDGGAVGGEPAQGPEQSVGLPGREHGRGLIEQDDASPAVQHAHDLQGLAFAHAEPFDRRVEIERQPCVLHHGEGVLSALVAIQSQPGPRFCSEDDVVERGEGLDEHEVLVHEADAASRSLPGGGGMQPLPLHEHRSAVRRPGAARQAEQGRFSSTVFPDHGVHATCVKLRRGPVDGPNQAEMARHSIEFYGGGVQGERIIHYTGDERGEISRERVRSGW